MVRDCGLPQRPFAEGHAVGNDALAAQRAGALELRDEALDLVVHLVAQRLHLGAGTRPPLVGVNAQADNQDRTSDVFSCNLVHQVQLLLPSGAFLAKEIDGKTTMDATEEVNISYAFLKFAKRMEDAAAVMKEAFSMCPSYDVLSDQLRALHGKLKIGITEHNVPALHPNI